MVINFRLIAKVGLLLVIIGLFMPVACDKNGFEIADYMMNHDRTLDGLLMYLVIVSAAIGVIVGIFLLMRKKINSTVDWFAIIVCIASGVIVYVRQFDEGPDLQTGAYMILAGWIIAMASQVISKINRE
ncbi:MAG: hypothetical protein LBI28_08490 [Treponema sp.]|jgi:hypothetical protein|nr:hypothetical protein [Treponema sp.]